MRIQLSDHFSYGKLLRFTWPSVIMMLFTSVYGVVDGFFISNYVGITPFAAVNLIWPLLMILGAVGFMFGAGGSALVSATLGAGQRQRANRIFSMLTYIAGGLSLVLMTLGIVFMEPLALWMGADKQMLPHCVTYGRILMLSLPAFILQNMFQNFLVTAEKPTMGLIVTLSAGVTNMVLDALFIAVFRWGVTGAATATAFSQFVGGIVPLVYFSRKNTSLLKLGATEFDGKALLATCSNGLSELVSNISMSLVSILYNLQLMRIAGEHGVAAYGAVMYVSFMFIAVFLGYAIGVAPVIGFHYGAQNRQELKGLFRKSNLLIGVAALVLSAAALGLSKPLARMFVGDEPTLMEMTCMAFRCYALSILFSGFSIFGSAFFTALSNGPVSAAISFLRTMVFQVASVLLLPVVFGINGVWYSLVVAELLATVVTLVFYRIKRPAYHF
ncbi:MAG: MATE family efflux transporter [Oscillospiraceae bacterium]|nr:MATE family efflux transporter [Oscillospiraceae bacterium]